MTYNKPEITVLGEAVHVIQGVKGTGSPDSPLPISSAYDLDE